MGTVTIGIRFRNGKPVRHQFSRCGEAFQLFRTVLQRGLSVYVKRWVALSVVAVSRTDRSLIVLCEGISQLARLSW
jgi:hypothetical protein